ncbi:MAG: DNA polymerase beta superfamily protein [Flammeovirgaceae bacterium]
MNEIIQQKFSSLQKDNEVNILYVCESGSRAWGFASPDSDYDVRFIYVHPKDFYLGIDEQRDVIELPINEVLDINGWELRKALRLLRKSNAPVFEWLQSPIIYQADAVFQSDVQQLMKEYFSPRSMLHHYLSMAGNVIKNELSSDEVKLKKYFYALRPLLASCWIVDRKEIPPMEFGKLRILLDSSLNTLVDELLTQKAQVNEKFLIQPIPELQHWLTEQLQYCEQQVPDALPQSNVQPLNELFRKFVV